MSELNRMMLLECTNKAYSSFRDSMIKTCNAKTADFPSFHMATKHRCELDSGEIHLNKDLLYLLLLSSKKILQKTNDPDDCLGKKNKVKKGITLKSKVVALKHMN